MRRDGSPWAHLRPDDVQKQLWYYAIDATMRTDEQLDAMLAALLPGMIDHPQLERGFALIREMRDRGATVDSVIVRHEVRRLNITLDHTDPIDMSRCSCWSAVVPQYLAILKEARAGRVMASIIRRAADALKAGMPAGIVAGHVLQSISDEGLT